MHYVFDNKTSSTTLNITSSITTPLAFHNLTRRSTSPCRPLFTALRCIDSGRNHFSSDKSWKKIRETSTACVAGATAVTLGTGWLGLFGFTPADAGVGGELVVQPEWRLQVGQRM